MPVPILNAWLGTFMNYKNTFNRLETLVSVFFLSLVFNLPFSSGEIKSSEHF